MIISRTPFRISFFGGGTDYPAWFRENGGSVLSTTINKYCHISCRHLPPFFTNRHRIVWSRIEEVSALDEIEHPSVRDCMRFLDVKEGLEVHHDGDLPARAGLGSSSSFTVGMLHALNGLQGRMPDREQLARDAIHVEQNMIRENVGCQDQVAVAFGGFNRIDFQPPDRFSVSKMILPPERLEALQDHLLLLFTGISRTASDIAGDKIKAMNGKWNELTAIQQMVAEGVKILSGGGPLDDFGRLLHESWRLKRSLTPRVSTSHVDEIYDRALKAGALGGKLLGAGGGGFMLFFAAPGRHGAVKQALAELLHVPFRFETSGSHIIYYEKNASGEARRLTGRPGPPKSPLP
jgi:D-glycero-alpha-D-manno-heptose-7-phosphate kinase